MEREKKSFKKNNELNLILSKFVMVPDCLEDPFSCRKKICLKIIKKINIGKIKWREKNRFKVGWETEGPPQIQFVNSLPKIGIADKVPVITVAPQKDICPQGSTYPKKAVAIAIIRIINPVNQT